MVDRPLSDEILAKAAKEGDTRAFEELFERYKKPVLNFIYRLIGNKETAEEVAQEVFMKAYDNLKIYDPDRKFSTWFYTIARNLAKNSLRDRKYFRDVSLEEPVFAEGEEIRLKDVIADSSASPDAIARDEELANEAQKVLDSLPLELKEVVTLVSVQGMTYQEAADILGCSVGNIANRLEEAKALFMKKLGIGHIRGKGSESHGS
jgi:RNA polymerase sigma-70 factor (ECF subfamily)